MKALKETKKKMANAKLSTISHFSLHKITTLFILANCLLYIFYLMCNLFLILTFLQLLCFFSSFFISLSLRVFFCYLALNSPQLNWCLLLYFRILSYCCFAGFRHQQQRLSLYKLLFATISMKLCILFNKSRFHTIFGYYNEIKIISRIVGSHEFAKIKIGLKLTKKQRFLG